MCALAMSAATLVACKSPPQEPRDTTAFEQANTTSTVRQRDDTTAYAIVDTLSPAYQQFSRFLSLAVATRVPHEGRTDSVYASGAEPGIDEHDTDMRWVAASRILSVSTAGDSARATAVITEVAQQITDHDIYRASFGIRDDTAHWRLVRDADSNGRWLVKGDAEEGFGVFHVGRDIRWVVGSRAMALAAVDSIRRARGLPLVR